MHLQVGLLTIALQGDTCTKNAIDLKYIFVVAFSSDVENERAKNIDEDLSSNILYTENELKVIETELSKTLTPKKVQNAMKILRGFQTGGSEKDLESGAVSEVKLVAKNTDIICICHKQINI